MQCFEPLKTRPLFLKIPEAMMRYGFRDDSGFRRFRRQLSIPSPDQAPFPVHHILKMDECWIATKLPTLRMKRKQYKAFVMATGQSLREIVQSSYGRDIRELIEEAPAEFRNHEITESYLLRLQLEDNKRNERQRT